MEEQRVLEDPGPGFSASVRPPKGRLDHRVGLWQARLHEEMGRRTSLPAPETMSELVTVSFKPFWSPRQAKTYEQMEADLARFVAWESLDLVISAGSRETRPRAACCADCVCQAGYRRNMSSTANLGAGSVRYELKSPGRYLPMLSHYDGRREHKTALLRAPAARRPMTWP